MLLLPSFTWNVDPVFLRLPRMGVAATVGAIALFLLVMGLRKKDKEQLTTAAIFGAVALLVAKFMGPTVELRYYSLLFVVVFLGGHALLNWQVKRGGGGAEVAGDFIVYGVLGVLIGARLGHVLFYDLAHALDDPLWVFKIWTGGLASHGAVVGLALAMYLFTRARRVSFIEGADRFAFAAALGATVVRIGNLFNSEIVGRKVPDQSWGMRFPRADHLADPPLRYPSQLFEIALGLAVLLGLWIADRRMGREKRPRGALISWFFALYFSGRLFTEFFKEYEAISPDSALTMGQYLSIPCALLGWFGIYRAYQLKIKAGWRSADEEDTDEGDADEEDADEHEQAAGEDRGHNADDDDDDDDEDHDDEDEPPAVSRARHAKPRDPDVEDEFEDGKLKKSRDPKDE
jgi:phosphatidylglycerol---prolipoprotein diacylglyceryl transferase